MRYLAILLIGPWLLVLAWWYWAYPKTLPRNLRRRVFDTLVLLLAAWVVVQSALSGFDATAIPAADAFGRPSGAIWQQVLPALYGYGGGVLVLGAALLVRHLIWRRAGSGRREIP